MMIWQFGVPNLALKFSDSGYIPGGHEQAFPSAFKGHPETHPGWASRMLYEGELITPNEESWLPFFRRDRWYDWNDTEPSLGGKRWSVDNPLIWEPLSIALELANRVLIALMQDRHPFLNTILFGYLHSWGEVAASLAPCLHLPSPFPQAMVILSYGRFRQHQDSCDPKIAQHMERAANATPEEYRLRLEALLERQIWSFRQDETAFGVTNYGNDGSITLNVGLLKLLIEGNITLAERCILQFYLANVILHELSHAISNSRVNEMFPEERDQNDSDPEPFIDFAGACETGFSFEHAIWGGVLELGPVTDMAQPPLGFYSKNWPFPDLFKKEPTTYEPIEGHPDFAAGTIIEKGLVPVEFASKMLSKAFWNDERIPRKSDRYFHRVPLFVSRTPNDPSRALMSYVRPMDIDMSRNENQLDDGEKNMVKEWRARQELWNSLRSDWWERLHNTWFSSPWGRANMRLRIIDFTEGHRKLDLAACCNAADNMVRSVGWGPKTTRGKYEKQLQESGEKWIPHVIGLLMMAALPIRTSNELIPSQLIKSPRIELIPSERARGRPTVRYEEEDTAPEHTILQSRFFNPFSSSPSSRIPIQSLTPTHYLDLAQQILQHLASAGKPLSTPWLREITRVEAALRAERAAQAAGLMPGRLVLHQPAALRSWARAWDFSVPEYDPEGYSGWLGGSWVDGETFWSFEWDSPGSSDAE